MFRILKRKNDFFQIWRLLGLKSLFLFCKIIIINKNTIGSQKSLVNKSISTGSEKKNVSICSKFALY